MAVAASRLLRRVGFLCGLAAAALSPAACVGQGEEESFESPSVSEQDLSEVTGANWMSALDASLLLSQVTIPGTHDSMARHEPIPGTAKCQDLNLAEQLEIGVRFIDIRCRHFNDSFTIHHGSVYQHANFDDVLDVVVGFLNAHPSEAVIMSVKQEHTASGNTRSFEQTFNAYLSKNPGKWNLGTAIPTLGAARGKITLLRRFGGAARGIDASSWPDDTTFTSGRLRVQDNYNVGRTRTKWSQVRGMLDEAASGSRSTLFVNFASGVYSFLGIPRITTVSNAINPQLSTFFTGVTGRFGIVAMDFADATRTAKIYNANRGTP